jgi:hypothetical protein
MAYGGGRSTATISNNDWPQHYLTLTLLRRYIVTGVRLMPTTKSSTRLYPYLNVFLGLGVPEMVLMDGRRS